MIGNNKNLKIQVKKLWSYLQTDISEHCGEILEFGCGGGYFTEHVLDLGYQYVGVDLNKDKLVSMQGNKKARYIHIESNYLPFEQATFDAVMTIMEFGGLIDDNDFKLWTNELARVIQRCGLFYIIDINKYPEGNTQDKCIRMPEEVAASLHANIRYIDLIHFNQEESYWYMVAEKF